MLTLIRQNPAFRTLPKWLLMSIVTATFVINLLTFYVWRQREGTDPLVVVSVIWLAVTLFLVFGEVRTRCTPFDMALPISTRKLWLSHIVAVTLAGVAIFAATVGPVAGGIWLLWKLSGKWMAPVAGMGGLAAHLCAGLVLAVVLLQNPRPSLNSLPRNKARAILSVFVMISVLALVLALNSVSPWTSLITLFVAATVGIYRYRVVPESFSLSVVETAPPDARERRAVNEQWRAFTFEDRPRGVTFGRFLNRVIWRCYQLQVKLKHSQWLTFPFVLLFGGLLSGLDGRLMTDSLRFNYIWMAAYMLIAFTVHAPTQLFHIDGLPIPRRRLFNVMVFPLFVAMIVGYGAGRAAMDYLEREKPRAAESLHLIQGRDDDNFYLMVPYDALEISWDGEIPDIVAPWGETQEPWARPLFPGSRVKMYAPYRTPPGSSIDFVAWQMSRAVEAVYGQSVRPEELRRRYLEERADGTAALKTDKLTIEADYPYFRRARPGGPVFPVVMGLTFILWMLCLAVYLQALRGGVSSRRRTAVAFGVMGIMLLGWLAVFLGPLVRLLNTGLVNGFLTIMMRQAGESSMATAGVWIVVLAACVAAYRLALWRFEKIEAVQDRKAAGTI